MAHCCLCEGVKLFQNPIRFRNLLSIQNGSSKIQLKDSITYV
jgi:hypothetical protein